MGESNSSGEKAVRAFQKARRLRHKKALDPVVDPILNRLAAEEAEAEASNLLRPPEGLLRGGREVLRHGSADEELTPAMNIMLSTLEHPDMISVEASEQRMNDALDAGVLQAALDASHSTKTTNSLEAMLCHQMAAAHHVAMKLVAASLVPGLPPVEQARLTNASARMMQVHQEGMLSLQRFRTGGRQTVVVQHVSVSNGGQAVVAGNIKNKNQD